MELQERVDQLNKLRKATERLRTAMFATMESGGYLDTIAREGSDLDRVKQFLAEFKEPIPPLSVDDVVAPGFISKPNPWVFPMFPGLGNMPFHPPEAFPWVRQLEAAFPELRREAQSSRTTFDTSFYDEVTQQGGNWYQGHATACGTLHDGKVGHYLPTLSSVIRDLPGCCSAELGSADCYYSVLEAGASINAHSSSDNLKVRCHLGLVIPPGPCAISVGGQTRGWEEGKVLILEDAFLHMVWNRTGQDRIVALIDFWHPDLAPPERAALSAGFKKSEMRRMICYSRSVTPEVTERMMRLFEAEDDDPSIARFWPRKPSYDFRPQGRITD